MIKIKKATEDIADISYSKEIRKGSVLEFKVGKFKTKLVVIGINEEIAKAYIISGPKVIPGMVGKVVSHETKIKLPINFMGSILNSSGEIIFEGEKSAEPIKGANSLEETAINISVFNPVLPIFNRTSIVNAMPTGIFTVDTMIPIGKGQRELIVGDRQTGKTSIAISSALSAAKNGDYVIYVSIGQSNSKALEILKTFEEHGISKQISIVHSSSEDYIGSQYLTPYTGISIAEMIASYGNDVLIVYDDLTKHADAYRSLSLLLGKRAGREAFPQDVFYSHSSLLERAGSFKVKDLIWNITALPIVETQREELANYIPTNVISITDGQIITSNQLFLEGMKPAIDVGLSVSRVGSNAQSKFLKHLSVSKLKIGYSIYKQKKKQMIFMDKENITEENKKIFFENEVLELIMNQTEEIILSQEETEIIIYLFNSQYFHGIKDKNIKKFVAKLQDFIINDKEVQVLKEKMKKMKKDLKYTEIQYLIDSLFSVFKKKN